MCLGREKLESHLADYKRRSDSLSKKEQDTLRDMRIVQEMYARGFDFLPMDIYKARARHFQVMGNKLMPLSLIHISSRDTAVLNRIPFFAPSPLPTMMATGVASPRAQGQLITSTEIPRARANP